MKPRRRYTKRSGTILVLSAFLMIAMFAFVAFAVDLGYLHVARTELQRTADASAVAAAWQLIDENALTGTSVPATLVANSQSVAQNYAGFNQVMHDPTNLGEQDIQIGYLADPFDPNAAINTANPAAYNAVRVQVRRTSDQNGEVPLFFARLLGIHSRSIQAEATAMVALNFQGFQAPASGENLGMLPFALDEDTWLDMLAGNGSDDWTWDAENEGIVAGADGVLEINLYPQGTGSPGNRGTVDIGSSNNSTADIARQILDGVTAEDLEHHGGKLELDEYGELALNGDTGISAGVKDELASIKGQPRVIPIFRQVTGPGNNAQYTIVQFAGVRILEVKLTGKMSSKQVIIQPALVKAKGGIPSPGTAPTSHFVYAPARIVR